MIRDVKSEVSDDGRDKPLHLSPVHLTSLGSRVSCYTVNPPLFPSLRSVPYGADVNGRETDAKGTTCEGLQPSLAVVAAPSLVCHLASARFLTPFVTA